MKQFTQVAALQEALQAARKDKAQLCVGLVPTMGALHEGHLSLVRRAKKECDLVVVSIFVNPIQFNNQEDLQKYPRTLEADLELLATEEVDMVLTPTVEEMYPEPVTEEYHFGQLEEVMEGPRRPGHFSGVAVVVRRLFDIVEPQKAFFGEKDFQQVAIIRNLLEQIKYPIELVPCPIVRADDGLALSSRNMRLSPEARAVAPEIYRILSAGTHMGVSVEDSKKYVTTYLNAGPFEVEYFEIVDDKTLQPIKDWDEAEGIVGCIAVWLTGVRLIDVIRYK